MIDRFSLSLLLECVDGSISDKRANNWFHQVKNVNGIDYHKWSFDLRNSVPLDDDEARIIYTAIIKGEYPQGILPGNNPCQLSFFPKIYKEEYLVDALLLVYLQLAATRLKEVLYLQYFTTILKQRELSVV